MRKKRFILSVLILCICIVTLAPIASDDPSFHDSKVIYVTSYFQAGDSDYTNAILRANNVLRSAGGGTLVFPEGDYRIKPGAIKIPTRTKWKGIGSARIYTKENSLYNVMLSTDFNSKDIIVENIIFDQRDDAALVPNAGALKGAFILHIYGSDNAEIRGCTFYTYGVCAIITQSPYSCPINTLKVYSNRAFFQRKADVFYDVSVFSLDGRSVYAQNNYIEAVKPAGFKYGMPRTALEVHMPNGSITGNVTKNTEIGVLHVNWPMLWDTYEPSYAGSLDISDNTFNNAIIGIDAWSSTTLAYTVTRNLTIKRNNINLYLSPTSFPAKGISLSDGNRLNSKFENIVIEGNSIKMTVDPAIPDAAARMSYLIPGDNTGAMFMNLSSNVINMEIRGNTVANFPYSFLNLYRKNSDGTSKLHSNIKVYNNTVVDSSYAYTYGGVFDASINIGYVKDVSVYDNIITNPSTKLLGQLNKIGTIVNLAYENNVFSKDEVTVSSVTEASQTEDTSLSVKEETAAETTAGTTETTVMGSNDQTVLTDVKVYENVIGTWANSKQIYVTNVSQCSAGDVIITPNNETAVIGRVGGNYIYLDEGVSWWYGGKVISCASGDTSSASVPAPAETVTAVETTYVVEASKTYSGVIGTWANSKQIYVTNVSQCSAGDVIITPNNETAVIGRVGGNYIFLDQGVSWWYGGKVISRASGDSSSASVPAPAETVTAVETTAVVEASKTYSGVIGTWANSKQIYVTNVSQCSAGDVIVTPNNETAVIGRVGGNYIFLDEGVSWWYGGKEIKLAD